MPASVAGSRPGPGFRCPFAVNEVLPKVKLPATRAQAPHRCDTLEIVSRQIHQQDRAQASGRCNSFAKHHDLAGCLICIPSTASHVTNGTLRRVAPSSSRNCVPEQRQPEAGHPGYQANREKARGHNWRYSMSPTIAECLEHARQCEWYAARPTTNRIANSSFGRPRSGRSWLPCAALGRSFEV